MFWLIFSRWVKQTQVDGWRLNSFEIGTWTLATLGFGNHVWSVWGYVEWHWVWWVWCFTCWFQISRNGIVPGYVAKWTMSSPAIDPHGVVWIVMLKESLVYHSFTVTKKMIRKTKKKSTPHPPKTTQKTTHTFAATHPRRFVDSDPCL